MQDIYQKKDRLVGDCLLTSSFLSYCGAFTFEFRQQLLHELWTKDVAERKLPVSEPFRYDPLFVDAGNSAVKRYLIHNCN